MTETEKNTGLTMQQLFSILKSGLKWLIIGLILGGLIAGSASVFLIPKKYTSSIQLYVSVQSETGTATGNLAAGQTWANSCSKILQNQDTLEKVVDELSFPTDVYEIRSAISITLVENTSILEINAITNSAQHSADICNTLAELAPDILKPYFEESTIEPIGKANVPDEPSSPSVVRNTLIGVFLGFVLAAAIVLLVSLLDNTVKDEDSVKQRLDVPVLGVLPSFNIKKGR